MSRYLLHSYVLRIPQEIDFGHERHRLKLVRDTKEIMIREGGNVQIGFVLLKNMKKEITHKIITNHTNFA